MKEESACKAASLPADIKCSPLSARCLQAINLCCDTLPNKRLPFLGVQHSPSNLACYGAAPGCVELEDLPRAHLVSGSLGAQLHTPALVCCTNCLQAAAETGLDNNMIPPSFTMHLACLLLAACNELCCFHRLAYPGEALHDPLAAIYCEAKALYQLSIPQLLICAFRRVASFLITCMHLCF